MAQGMRKREESVAKGSKKEWQESSAQADTKKAEKLRTRFKSMALNGRKMALRSPCLRFSFGSRSAVQFSSGSNGV